MTSLVKRVSTSNSHQIINMGGPWVGNLLIDSKLISDNCIVDDLIFDDINKNVFFIKYHNISKWQSENYFTINYCNLSNSVVYEYYKHFNMVYIKEIINENQLEIYLAFHDKDVSNKKIFDLNEEKKAI